MAAGLFYNYLYQQGPDSYVDYIGANEGTLFFKSQDGQGRSVNYNGPSDEYRAIHSTFIFGALQNDTYNKSELMDTYIEYLISGPIGIEEYEASEYLDNLAVFPNPASQTVNLRFALLHAGRVKIKVYNTAGQLVRQLIDKGLTIGNHQLIWNGTDDYGHRLSSGCYMVRIETDRSVINKMIILVK